MFSRIVATLFLSSMFIANIANCQNLDTTNLPIEQVTLFSSGVGYFQHAGSVSDNQDVSLRFANEDFNDLLKSMVVQDLDGGSIAAVAYGATASVNERLSKLGVDLRESPTLAELLQQCRGEFVTVSSTRPVVGAIVGVELKAAGIGENTALTEMLNLMTPEGLMSLPLSGVSSITFGNEKINQELASGLAMIAEGRTVSKREILVQCRGAGNRRVRVGYVVATPIWKTTYRMVLRDNKPAFLQGWAVVENETDVDWTDVRVQLIHGRPVSFQMNLQTPYFVNRPQVALELFGQPLPNVTPATSGHLAIGGGGLGGGGFGGGGFGGGGGGFTNEAGALPTKANGSQEVEGIDLTQGVVSQASATEAGEFFRYDIESPVTLASRHSAMLPIVQDAVEAAKLSVFTADVGEGFTFHAVRLKNSTNLHLTGGPIAVYEDQSYAGDAQIRELPAGEQCLISYAIDPETPVSTQPTVNEPQIMSINRDGDKLLVEWKTERTFRYAVKYRGAAVRTLVIEHPRPHGPWMLASPAATEESTKEHARFHVELQPNTDSELIVTEATSRRETLPLLDLEIAQITELTKTLGTDNAVRQQLVALRELLESRDSTQTARAANLAELRQIEAEQERIRKNMDVLDRQSELYKQYVATLAQQEKNIQDARQQATQHAAKSAELDKQIQETAQGNRE